MKNDCVPETFRLRHTVNGQLFPSLYLKVAPLQSWGPSFNFSIWCILLTGDDTEEVVRPALAWHHEVRAKPLIADAATRASSPPD